ncbi:CAAX protease [Brachybacterium sp. UNK5269]|uniref:CAAX protease n=1 Tax=Brachybacterium sp. UNK5269 TaxID=3408576 RepID=UPI003BAF6FC1
MSAPAPSRPVPYHRLATLRPAWAAGAKPLLTIAAAFVAYVVLASVVLVLTILVLAVMPGVNVAIGVTSGDPTSPLDVVLALVMGAMWLPAGIIGVRVGGWRPLGTAWSVAARLRRERLGALAGGGAAMAIVVVAVAAIAGALAGTDGAAAPGAASAPQLLLVTLLLLGLAPLQAAGLELALRGVVMQALGSWLRSPLLPILAATAVALIGRELSVPVALPALALALAAAVLAWKSGGLELPIVLTATVTLASHLVSALGAGTAAGAGAAALNAGAAAPGTSAAALAATAAEAGAASLAGGIGGAVALLLLTAVMVVLISRREGVALREPVGRPAAELAPEPVPF